MYSRTALTQETRDTTNHRPPYSSRRMHHSFLTIVVGLFCGVGTQAHAQPEEVTLLRDSLTHSNSLRLLISPSASASGCSTELRYGARSADLSGTERTGQLFLQFPASTGLQIINLSILPALRARGQVAIKALIACADSTISSEVVTIKLPRNASGSRTLRDWASKARKVARKSEPTLTRVFGDSSFSELTDLQASKAAPGYVFVLEKSGKISALQPRRPTVSALPLLDLSALLVNDGERGLLGLALHPNLKTNPYLYVNYSRKSDGATIIARYTFTSLNPPQADPGSALQLMEVEQPFSNHNGGQIAFSPDGFLYIGFGDGGSANDPFGNGQDPTTALGSLFRIDVNRTAGGKPYAIPASNPFVGNSGNIPEETYATGFRNPWRFSFDSKTKELWLADVGQDAYEEIDIVEKGKNYGWNITEGFSCFSPATNCNKAGLTDPIYVYSHSLGQSITGGYVYRGKQAPSFAGHYIYGDFISGRLWNLIRRGKNKPAQATLIQKFGISPSSFGVDAQGELYLLDYQGKIFKFGESRKVRVR